MKAAPKKAPKKGIKIPVILDKWATSRARATQQLDGTFQVTKTDRKTGKRITYTQKPGDATISTCTDSSGNMKLRKTIAILRDVYGWTDPVIGSFALPAYSDGKGGKICHGASDCVAYCYAMQTRYVMPLTSDLRFRNLITLERAQERGGVEAMTAELVRIFEHWIRYKTGRSRNIALRLHDSGDFFCQDYVDSMAAAVTQVRQWARDEMGITRFIPYAYTKSLDLDLEPLWKAGVQLVQSHGGRFDEMIDPRKPIAQVAGKDQPMPKGWRSGNSEEHLECLAIIGYPRIWLPYHGTLSEPKALTTRPVQLFQITENKRSA